MLKLMSFALILLSIAQTCEAASHRIAFQVTSPSRRQRTQSYRGNDRTTTRRWAEPADESNGINTDVAAPATTPLTPALPTTESSAVSTTSTTAATAAGESYVRCGRCQTYYTLVLEDYGLHKASSKGCRLECSVCQHSWFQSKDRILTLRDGYELVPLPPQDLERIALNLQEGKPASFTGQVKLYVGNIAFECKEEDIFQLFSSIGSVGDVSLVRDDSGKMRGFGFVTMRSKEDGEAAVAKLDGSSLRGRNIAVRESNN